MVISRNFPSWMPLLMSQKPVDVSDKIPTDNPWAGDVHNFRFQVCTLYHPMALIRIAAAFAAIWLSSSVSAVRGDIEEGGLAEVRIVQPVE
jgi:hypothetical protein